MADNLDWLEGAGIEGSPRFLGRDTEGRHVLTFAPGVCAAAVPATWVRSEALLAPLGRLVLRIFADTYGWTDEERRRLPELGIAATRLAFERVQHNAQAPGGGWARILQEGGRAHQPPARVA